MTFPNRTVKTEPVAGSLVTLPEVKEHLSLFDDTTFDNYINRLMIVATGHVGEVTGRNLDDVSIVDYYDRFGTRMYLSEKAVDGVPVITYRNRDNTIVTIDADDYIVDDSAGIVSLYFPAPISISPGLSRAFSNPITVTYTAIDELVEDQEEIKQAILLMIADMFTHRENQIDASLTTVNITMDRLLRPHRSNLI